MRQYQCMDFRIIVKCFRDFGSVSLGVKSGYKEATLTSQ